MAKKTTSSELGTLVGISIEKQRHGQKVTHRSPSGQFKQPPGPQLAKQKPITAPSLDQDAGGGYNRSDDEIQQ